MIPIDDSDQLEVGRFLIAIGNPFGLQQTGVVSSLGRVIESPGGRFIGEIKQTDAAVNPGNSAGPLLVYHRELLGDMARLAAPEPLDGDDSGD